MAVTFDWLPPRLKSFDGDLIGWIQFTRRAKDGDRTATRAAALVIPDHARKPREDYTPAELADMAASVLAMDPGSDERFAAEAFGPPAQTLGDRRRAEAAKAEADAKATADAEAKAAANAAAAEAVEPAPAV